jgi:uncharacterized membrane protein
MASKSKRARMAPVRNLSKTFLYWAIAVFVVKLIIIFNIQGGNIEISGRPFFLDGIWLGADGENYITGFDALIREGIFSEAGILNYWPAGYPLFIMFLSFLSQGWVLMILAVVQSAIFSWATLTFATQITRTRLRNFSYIVFLLILLNPTLSLSSLTVGYESLAASGFLISLALIIQDLIEKNESKFKWRLIIVSGIFGFLTFIQPRLVLSGVLIVFFWLIVRKGFKLTLALLAGSLVITLFFPATLIFRNNQATGINTISTNLGNTMNLGAGDKATGGYNSKEKGVDCNIENRTDNDLVKCVLNWYLKNPSKSLKLFYNKSIYFWSPWFGPEANGTMARNPWLKISPLRNITSTQEGLDFVYGGIGKLISWIWLLSGIALLLNGFKFLWQQKSLERFMASLAMIAIFTNWLISLLSIGDHRFRIPIMGMSLFLQAIGIKALFKGKKPLMVEGPALR